MNELVTCIKLLLPKLTRLRKDSLKETPTRVIFIDPILQAMGWDVRDPDVVQLEYPTVDGKSVDYALKINRKAVLLVEAKALGSSLDDVKSITQVVGYAANDGIVWCILTNGVQWRVYRSIEKCPAPDKLMYEVSYDRVESEGISTEEIATLLWRLSRDEMAKGTLDALGEQAFTDEKVRKALDRLMVLPPRSVINAVRAQLSDDTLTPQRIKDSLSRIWKAGIVSPDESDIVATGEVLAETRPGRSASAKKAWQTRRSQGATTALDVLGSWIVEELRSSPGLRNVTEVLSAIEKRKAPFLTEGDRQPQKGHEKENIWMYKCRWAITKLRKAGVLVPDSPRGFVELAADAPQKLAESKLRSEHDELHHTEGKPQEIVQLYREIDRFCLSLSPGDVQKKYRAMSVNYSLENRIFCCVRLQRNGLRVWLKLKYDRLPDTPSFARDVTNVGHYGSGDLELSISNIAQFPQTKALIRQSAKK